MNKYYAVRIGRKPGVYKTWDECRGQTDHYPGARFKSFPSHAEAAAWVAGGGTIETPSSTAPGVIVRGNSTIPAFIPISPSTTRTRAGHGRFYAVAVGHTPGIFTDHKSARDSHDGFPGAKYRRFDTYDDAETYLCLHGIDVVISPGVRVDDGDGEQEDGGEQNSETDEDGSAEENDDSSSTVSPTVTPPTPGSFMMSVYESTQRELGTLTPPTTEEDNDSTMPSSAQQEPPPSIMRPPPSSYFAHRADFEADDDASFEDEFSRYMSSQDIQPRTAVYRKLRTKAISHELKLHYSSQQSLLDDDDEDEDEDEDDEHKPPHSAAEVEVAFRLDVYQNMCRALRLPAYETEQECTRALREPLVNIVDFIDAARHNRPVKIWTDWEAFRQYTLQDDKRIDKEEAKADHGFLAKLLRMVSRKDGLDNRRGRKRRGAHGAGPGPAKRARPC